MQIFHLIDTNHISVFIDFTQMTSMEVFRIIVEKGSCRLILHQRVIVNEAQKGYLVNLPSIGLLTLCNFGCKNPAEYRKDDVIARFFHLHCRRYWIPQPVTIGSRQVLTEWAEYETDEFQIDFTQYSEAVSARWAALWRGE